MFETKLPRKIVGMNRNPKWNSGYNSEALDEFLHGKKEARANTATMEQLHWPILPNQDAMMVWPSQVLLYPSLGVDALSLKVNTNQDTINQYDLKELIQNNIKTLDLDHVTNDNSMNCRRSSALEISKSLGQHKVDKNEIISQLSHCSEINRKTITESPIINEKLTTTHDALKVLCVSCAEDGEKIAKIHCNRPFFKKIDGLCDRIKKDLIYHDSVSPHINTQGIVWAIKDFIFVCTRIVNAWNITKAYVYDSSEGLNKVRTTLSSEFVPSFVAWQNASLNFVENLMMSFLCFDILFHDHYKTLNKSEFLKKLKYCIDHEIKQQTIFTIKDNSWEQCGCPSCKIVMSSQSTHDALLKLSIVCFTYGEKVAKNYNSRPFFKKIDSLCDHTKYELNHFEGALSNVNSQGIVWTIKELIFACTRIMNAWNITRGYIYGSSKELDTMRSALSSEFMTSFTAWEGTTLKFVEHLRLSFLRLDNLAYTESNNFRKEDVFKQLKVFKDHLQQLQSADVFFKTQFTWNYFPDFIAKTPNFKDVRSIIKQCQSDAYASIFDVVHDVRVIIYQVKMYLKNNTDPKLENAANRFKTDVDKILTQKTFRNYHFDHIEGKPNEVIFL